VADTFVLLPVFVQPYKKNPAPGGRIVSVIHSFFYADTMVAAVTFN